MASILLSDKLSPLSPSLHLVVMLHHCTAGAPEASTAIAANIAVDIVLLADFVPLDCVAAWPRRLSARIRGLEEYTHTKPRHVQDCKRQKPKQSRLKVL
jgi:hypothetical protein